MMFDSTRPFGTEIELNALDGRDSPEVDGKLPEGIDHVGNLVAQYTKSYIEIRKWGPTHHNSFWVVKPDGSCGMEVCSPVLRGIRGIRHVCGVIGRLAEDPLIEADDRCSFHVHAGVEDLSGESIGTILAWWVKCEATLLAAMPNRRKMNRYCRQAGLTDYFAHDRDIDPYGLISFMGGSKYWTANTFHLVAGRRKAMEFRIMDEKACLDPEGAFNWVVLCLHFMERAICRGWPRPYQDGDPWSSFLWLDPDDVWRFLGFDGRVRLCPVLSRVREWLALRWWSNQSDGMGGPWSCEARSAALGQAARIVKSVLEVRHGSEAGVEPGLRRDAGRDRPPDERPGEGVGPLHGAAG